MIYHMIYIYIYIYIYIWRKFDKTNNPKSYEFIMTDEVEHFVYYKLLYAFKLIKKYCKKPMDAWWKNTLSFPLLFHQT